ncbi:UDP-N-acetylmuramate dehydrogenase [Patescibacteria group bacterium]|nr:UDP-N-acetylmuramate dehydrogenase [Patescibacteria group bacterium]
MNISVQQNVSTKEYNTYRVGGPARFFAEAKSWEAFLGLREFAKKQGVPYMVLGGGSNVLFADDGYPGLVILNRMEKIIIHGVTVTAEGAASLARLVLIAAEHNLGGISGLSCVPGSIGGAVYGNAGVPDLCIKDVFLNATILPANGNKPIIVGQDYAKFSYRDSNFKKTGDIILSATLELKRVPAPLIRKEINRYVAERVAKQPSGLTCGSFFKNSGHFPSAGWLIDQSGCKGMTEGGALVSEKHANWIMNTGKATASDIINLALKVHKIVKAKFDVDLEPEVQIIPANPFARKN